MVEGGPPEESIPPWEGVVLRYNVSELDPAQVARIQAICKRSGVETSFAEGVLVMSRVQAQYGALMSEIHRQESLSFYHDGGGRSVAYMTDSIPYNEGGLALEVRTARTTFDHERIGKSGITVHIYDPESGEYRQQEEVQYPDKAWEKNA